MNARRWLLHLYALSATVRRCFLHALFRKPLFSRRVVTPAAPPAGAMPPTHGTDVLTHRDDCTIRFISTDDARRRQTDGDLIAHLSHSPQHETSDEIMSAVKRLHALASRNSFPLDYYWRSISAGFASVDEWVHYGHSSRVAALDSFLTPPPAHNEMRREDEPTVFVLHCSRSNY